MALVMADRVITDQITATVEEIISGAEVMITEAMTMATTVAAAIMVVVTKAVAITEVAAIMETEVAVAEEDNQ